jgi:ABC-2 type transport system ATP-binding protein
MVEVFREEVAALRDGGATVLLSSHVLSEVEELCDRVTILRDGRTVEAGTIDSLRALARIHVTAATRRPIAPLEHLDGLSVVERTPTTLTCEVERAGLDALLGVLHDASVTSLECRPPSLESIFLSRYTTQGTVRA